MADVPPPIPANEWDHDDFEDYGKDIDEEDRESFFIAFCRAVFSWFRRTP